MMSIETKEAPALIPISEFTAIKQVGLFETLKQPRFSGQLILTGPRKQEWTFYLYMGRIMYVTGGLHPVRRWYRQLTAHCPQIPLHDSFIRLELTNIPASASMISWEYQLLCLWVERQRMTRDQAAKMIVASVVEVLFDITQSMQVTYQVQGNKSLSTKLALINAEQAIAGAQRHWQAWQAAKVADRSPNQAPVIRQPLLLKKHAPAKVSQTLTKLLDGQRTLRDIAMQMGRDVTQVTRSLLPYVQLGAVELVEVADKAAPMLPVAPTSTTAMAAQSALIACVDDSPGVCQNMEQILTGAGYQFVSVSDPLRAIAILLSRKPDLIFLDLVMPNANGYEICSQLRKLSIFRKTPIIILTGNDGIVDRVRAKVVGSTDFLSKSVESGAVLGVVRKYLKKGTLK
ncbi:MAG: response regulator [Cyanothece sp. SIO1E1]|nr:response regulator [Cyanothece sp. SIO1E1]